MLVCPSCRAALDDAHASLRCTRCGRQYSREHGIADFANGRYYDAFDPAAGLSEEQRAGFMLESEGTRRRVLGFYEPLIRAYVPDARRVLDCGCGNGLAVDLLAGRGFEAWGNDVSQLRKRQWNERVHRERLVVASGTTLPFPDGYFDVVISSGVIEHIGVDESRSPHYEVRPRATRDEERLTFVLELLRVTRNGGCIFIDAPNGRFPIDFWHADAPGQARLHALNEAFLPTARELRSLFHNGGVNQVRFLSPYGRLQFQQVRRHWYGRALMLPALALLQLMRILPPLAASPLNPFLVMAARK